MGKIDKAHELTDKELEALEKRIAETYQKARDDMQKKVESYFVSFAKRDEEQRELLTAGKIDNNQYTQWRLTQIGRGQRYEAMRDALAERMTKANEIAMAYANDNMAKVYALNHAYTIQSVVAEADGALDAVGWTMYDEQTIKRLITEQPDLMPYYPEARAVRRMIDLEYGKKQITASVTSGILQGNSINKIAKDLMDNITSMSQTSAIRAARTATTAAENAGRQAAADDLESKGAILNKGWMATHDGRTREEHLNADGQIVGNDEPFIVGGEKLMFPGDKSLGASGWNLYNCRCTRITKIVGFKSTLTDEQRKKANIRVMT